VDDTDPDDLRAAGCGMVREDVVEFGSGELLSRRYFPPTGYPSTTTMGVEGMQRFLWARARRANVLDQLAKAERRTTPATTNGGRKQPAREGRGRRLSSVRSA
jgi:hypothetical protein